MSITLFLLLFYFRYINGNSINTKISECLVQNVNCEAIQDAKDYYLTSEGLCQFEEIEIIKVLKETTKLRRFLYQRYRRTYDSLCIHYKETGDGKMTKLIHLKNGIYNFLGITLNANEHNKIGFKCPPAEEIAPCTCSFMDMKTINCSEVGSFITMKSILNSASFPSLKFDKFTYTGLSQISNNAESILYNNSFGPLSFETIYIEETGLQEIQADAFNGSQSTLTRLIIDSNVAFSSFPFDAMSDFLKLQVLEITDSAINDIPVISNIQCLTVLSLTSNKLTKLDINSFSGLPSLTILDVGYNMLENIFKDDGLNLPTPHTYLYFDFNSLEYMSVFSCNQPYLLDESYNKLTTFNQNIYEPMLDAMSFVITLNNSIECSQYGWVIDMYINYDQMVVNDCWNEI